jgi:hypothetical protein
MNASAWQPSRTVSEGYLQWFVVGAAAIALGRGNVTILDIVVLDRRGRRRLRFAAGFVGRFALLAGSAHDIPSMWTDRRLAGHLIHNR